MTTEPHEKLPLAAADEENVPADGGSTSAVPFDSSSRHVGPLEAADKHAIDEDDDDSSEDFEFAVRDPDAFPSVTADEIFAGGRILPAYPVFNRDLLLRPSAAGEPAAGGEDAADQIPLRRLLIVDGETRAESLPDKPAAGGERCERAPELCKKSASTGSSLRWRLRDMMVGRSHSDGKEKFVFLEAAPPPPPPPAKKKIANPSAKAAASKGKGAKKGGRAAEVDVVTAHGLFYGKGTSEKGGKGPRRSFLPYRQELLGLFAPVNGLRRTQHPF